MSIENVFRRLRGALGNAVVWGACWSAAIFVVSAVMAIAGEPVTWRGTWQLAARLSVVGGLAGAVFSTFIGFVYRGRRLSEISWLRFGIGGGVVAGLFVPTLMFVGRTISGDGPLPMQKWISSALIAAAFGSVAAAASMKLAQRGDTLLPGGSEDQLDRLEGVDPLASAEAGDTRARKAPARPSAED